MRASRVIVYAWVAPTTAVGLIVCAAALATGGRARSVDGVLEVHGGFATTFLRRIVGLFLANGASAMTLGHVVVGLNERALERTRAHERVHVRQCERWGPLFIPAYLLASAWQLLRGRSAYMDNPFEREAYDTTDGL